MSDTVIVTRDIAMKKKDKKTIKKTKPPCPAPIQFNIEHFTGVLFLGTRNLGINKKLIMVSRHS